MLDNFYDITDYKFKSINFFYKTKDILKFALFYLKKSVLLSLIFEKFIV